jgi:hypothetical protein
MYNESLPVASFRDLNPLVKLALHLAVMFDLDIVATIFDPQEAGVSRVGTLPPFGHGVRLTA